MKATRTITYHSQSIYATRESCKHPVQLTKSRVPSTVGVVRSPGKSRVAVASNLVRSPCGSKVALGGSSELSDTFLESRFSAKGCSEKLTGQTARETESHIISSRFRAPFASFDLYIPGRSRVNVVQVVTTRSFLLSRVFLYHRAASWIRTFNLANVGLSWPLFGHMTFPWVLDIIRGTRSLKRAWFTTHRFPEVTWYGDLPASFRLLSYFDSVLIPHGAYTGRMWRSILLEA